MDANLIIDALGGTAEVARLCRVKSPSVSEWRHSGIPDARRQFLELLRPDVFAALATRQQDDSQTPDAEQGGPAVASIPGPTPDTAAADQAAA